MVLDLKAKSDDQPPQLCLAQRAVIILILAEKTADIIEVLFNFIKRVRVLSNLQESL
jgi:hypothetical protein